MISFFHSHVFITHFSPLCFGRFKEERMISSDYFKSKYTISLFTFSKNCTSDLNFGNSFFFVCIIEKLALAKLYKEDKLISKLALANLYKEYKLISKLALAKLYKEDNLIS